MRERGDLACCARCAGTVVAVRTGDAGYGGLSFLVVERGDGVSATALRKLGWRASDTAETTTQSASMRLAASASVSTGVSGPR